MNEDSYNFPAHGDISSALDFAHILGVFTAQFCVIEFVPVILLAFIINDDPDERPLSWGILSPIQSIKTKLEIIKSCLNRSRLSDEKKSEISSILSHTKEVIEFRNRLMHSRWQVSEGQVNIITKGKEKTIAPEEIRENIKRIHIIVGECASATGIPFA